MQEAEEMERKLSESGVEAEIAAWCAQRHEEGDSTELLQLMLLRALWEGVLRLGEGSPLSIERWPELAAGGLPFLDGAAARRLLDSGASPTDLDAVIRSAQSVALYDACRTLDGGGRKQLEAALGKDLARGLGWAVVAQDPKRTPPKSLGGLHSTFEQLEPKPAEADVSE